MNRIFDQLKRFRPIKMKGHLPNIVITATTPNHGTEQQIKDEIIMVLMKWGLRREHINVTVKYDSDEMKSENITAFN